MKKSIVIFALALITAFITLNSLFIFSALTAHKSDMRLARKALLNRAEILELNETDLHQNTKELTWVEDDEIKIGDNYYDILKVEKIAGGKSRLYIYCDTIEKNINIKLQHHQNINTGSHKKGGSNLLADLLNLKTYTKHNTLNLSHLSVDYNFLAFQQKTTKGYHASIDQPPAFIF